MRSSVFRLPPGPGLLALVLLLAAPSGVAAKGRTFLYREANLAFSYSMETQELTAAGVPTASSVGLEFVHTQSTPAKGSTGLLGVDIHLRVNDPTGPESFDLFYEDAWALFAVGGRRSQLRIGHFNIPYGMNPVMEPRGIFRMPLEAIDLGFKKDWGIAWQRELGEYDLEFGGFSGMGGNMHWRNGSHLLSTRIGTPTYRNFEYGVSFLLGNLAPTMGNARMSDMLMRRTRAGFDAVYMYGNYTIFKAELSGGADDGRSTVGGLFAVDWIPPMFTRWVFAAQLEGLRRNMMVETSDMVRYILEASVSIGRLSVLRVDLVRTLESPMGTSTELAFLFHYYGR